MSGSTTTTSEQVSESVRALDGCFFHLDRLAVTLAGLMMEPPPDAQTRACVGNAEFHVRELAQAIDHARQHWAHAEHKRCPPTAPKKVSE